MAKRNGKSTLRQTMSTKEFKIFDSKGRCRGYFGVSQWGDGGHGNRERVS